MKALRSNKTGHIMGWNRSIWKTGLCEMIDLGDKPTPQRILDDIEAFTGGRVVDGAHNKVAFDPETGDIPRGDTRVTGVDATTVVASPQTLQLAPEDDEPVAAPAEPAPAPVVDPEPAAAPVAEPAALDDSGELNLDELNVDEL